MVLTWTPQRRVWGALALSSVALVVCLGLGVRRPRRAATPGPAPAPRGSPAGATKVGRRRVVVAAAAGALIGAVVVAPWAGVVTGLAVAAACVRRPARLALGLAPAVLLSGAALYVAQLQLRYRFPLKLSWPTNFETATPLAWLAVLLLAGSVLVDLASGGTQAPPTRGP